MVLLYRAQNLIIDCYSFVINRISMFLSDVSYGKHFVSSGKIFIRNYSGKNGINIGNDVSINSSPVSSAFNGVSRTRLMTGYSGKIIIEDGVSMSNTGIYSQSLIVIGKQTNIGGGSRICDTDFHSIYSKYRLDGNTNVVSKPVHIGERVFIGGHCLILKGVTIGDEAVIGGNSVVTRDIPAREIWAGNPAKFIKKIE